MRSLSTGKVAKITQTSVQTVIRWIDTGMLKAWRVPGSRFRRIEEGDLRVFMTQHNIPLEYLDAEAHRVLVVSDNESLRTLLAPMRVCGLPISCAPPFEAGMRMVDSPVAVVLIDEALGDATVQSIAATLNSRGCDIPSARIIHDPLGSRDSISDYLRHRLRDILRDQP